MHAETFERLRTLNHEFYQTFAGPFADKRSRLQPGVMKALERIASTDNMLDLGCGHGGLARELVAQGHRGAYLGIDLSAAMIAMAQDTVQQPNIHFEQADLSQDQWRDVFNQVEQQFQPPYARIACFATLHHIPGETRREALVREVSHLMEPGSLWILSVWDFKQSERLRERIVPWHNVGIDGNNVEAGDYLLDWRHGGSGLRYVHHFTPERLEALAHQGGLEMIDTFHMDGEKGRLGLYQVWRKP